MSGIGNQAGSFQAPHIPQKSAAQQAQQQGAAIAKTTATVSQPVSPNPANTVAPKQLTEKQVEVAEQKHTETVKDIRSSISEARQKTDSFQQRIVSGDLTERANSISELASKVKKDEDLKQRATEFAQKINNQESSVSNLRKPAVDKPEAQQNHQLAAQAVQSQDPETQKKSNKKTKDPVDAMLEKIFTLGGDRGKKFVAFIQREQAKGPLLDSTKELIQDFHATIKGDSLSTSELLATGEENINLMRSMVSLNNLNEVESIQNTLSTSIANSAGERADLLAVRNLEKNQSRIIPPSPSVALKKLPTELAIEFVSSIDFGVIKAPWDVPLKVA